MLNIVSWNVNGLRSCFDKGFTNTLALLNPDIICLQETKIQAGQLDLPISGYSQYYYYARKAGYSGTAVFTKEKPLNVFYGIGDKEFDDEGRCITLEFVNFYLVNIYAPNAKYELARLSSRMRFEDRMLNWVSSMSKIKPVIYCGDFNVAHEEIDLANPLTNIYSAGFSDEERGAFTRLLNHGFIDTFRYIYKTMHGAYSFYSYRVRAKNSRAGWRLDYFLVSEELKQAIISAGIYQDITGSDHVPVSVTLSI